MPAFDDQTDKSYLTLTRSVPCFMRICRLNELFPELPAGTLLHAGPPYRSVEEIPQPVLNAARASALQEGSIDEGANTIDAIKSGLMMLKPAQDFNVVTPLAFVVGPSMYAVVVQDANDPRNVVAAPLNDGPPDACLRFGTDNLQGRQLLNQIYNLIGKELSEAFLGPVELLPLLSKALHQGDDLHGQVAAANRNTGTFFSGTISEESEAYLARTGQFILNVIMAACAVMLKAGDHVDGSRMVTAGGGNGHRFGYKKADNSNVWHCFAAERPVGPQFAGPVGARPLPAIGDSAVIDITGFGAACLRFSPALSESLGDLIDDSFRQEVAHAPFIGGHPEFDLPGLKLGLDLSRDRTCLGTMLGMVEEAGEHGLIGRGIAPWPKMN